jgi:hypothetical protein
MVYMDGNKRDSCSVELVPLAAHSKNSANNIHTQMEHLNKINKRISNYNSSDLTSSEI